MKIAVIAHLKFPIAQPFVGGLERHTHLLTRLLKQRGHDVTLFAADGTDPELGACAVCPPTGEGLDDVIRAALIDEAEFEAYRGIMAEIRHGGFDVLHNNSLHDLPLQLGARLATPMLTVLHTPPFPSLAAGVAAAGHRPSFAAVSGSLAQQWRHLVPSMAVVGNGIDLAAFPFRLEPDATPFAFWSGRIVPEKGLHLAIDAARAAGWHLSFAGPRYDRPYWDAEIAPRLGLGVSDHGHLDNAELAAIVGAARVVIVTPCWEEPFGLVVAEALACGTPVAGFRRGALPTILDAACGRLARQDDVSDLARAMVEAATLPRLPCRVRAESLFDCHVMIEAYEALYRELIAGQPAPSPRKGRLQTSSAANA